MASRFFPEVSAPIQYEGPSSRNPLAFKVYQSDQEIGGKTMAEHLRFAVCYWHTFRGNGLDPFGAPTMSRPWSLDPQNLDQAKEVMDAAFEFFTLLNIPFWCFHDVDILPHCETLAEMEDGIQALTEYAGQKQAETGVKLLWGTANLFSHPRYQAGAATNPDPEVFAYACAQVKMALEATHALGGEGYVFWGGREGYDTLWNTKVQQEREQFARLLHMAVEHAHKIGFKGQFYIEPKPCEPTKHQYDRDVATCLNFLREFDLLDHLKLNIETNHATLAGHTMAHELRLAREAGALGSIDANRGDELLGWDTDQFPTDVYLTTQIMLEVLAMGGFTTGGLNFDAKVRRQSFEPIDLFYAHIGGMDAFAQGLKIAHAIHSDGEWDKLVDDRYSGWNNELGTGILQGQLTLDDCALRARELHPQRQSGRQEYLENLINRYVMNCGS